jgi:hypothetical protein
MLAITLTFIHGEDALKTLTVLEQPVLPVELNATLEPGADFRQGVDGTSDAGEHPRNSRTARSGDRHRVRQCRPSSAWARGLDRMHLTPPSARRLVANCERIQALFGNENEIR